MWHGIANQSALFQHGVTSILWCNYASLKFVFDIGKHQWTEKVFALKDTEQLTERLANTVLT